MNEHLLIQEKRKGLANIDNQDSLYPDVMQEVVGSMEGVTVILKVFTQQKMENMEI